MEPDIEGSVLGTSAHHPHNTRVPCSTRDATDKGRGWARWTTTTGKGSCTQRTFPLPGCPGRIPPADPSPAAFNAKTERKGAWASLADPIKMDGRERNKGTCRHCLGSNPPVQKQAHSLSIRQPWAEVPQCKHPLPSSQQAHHPRVHAPQVWLLTGLRPPLLGQNRLPQRTWYLEHTRPSTNIYQGDQ